MMGLHEYVIVLKGKENMVEDSQKLTRIHNV